MAWSRSEVYSSASKNNSAGYIVVIRGQVDATVRKLFDLFWYKLIPRLFTIDDGKQHGIRHGPYSLSGLDLGPFRIELDYGAKQFAAILAGKSHLVTDFQ